MSQVNHPSHYGGESDPFEAIKVIEAWADKMPPEVVFHLGNTIKYLSRCGKKENAIQDLEKARWYLDRAIQKLKNGSRTTKGKD